MRESLVALLRCPGCAAAAFRLEIDARDAREIREGRLRCGRCGLELPIRRGVVHALAGAPQPVLDEAAGWVRLLDVPAKRHEFRDDWILALPFLRPEQSPEPDSVRIWNQVGTHFYEGLDRLAWGGRRVLEVGAGRCWGVAELARRGAAVVGMDVLTHRYLGLDTADVWFEAGAAYFERVCSDMHRMPFRSGVFDAVVSTSSLHHTDRLGTALAEAERVLRPGGRALFLNEPVVAEGEAKPDLSDSPEVQHGIIESRFTHSEWMEAFTTAGFRVEDVRLADDMHVVLRKPGPKGLRGVVEGLRAGLARRRGR